MICETYVQFFSTLSDSSQLEIIKSLRIGSKSVTELANDLKFEQSRVSHNLRKLKEQGFVKVKKEGKNSIYEIDRGTILPLLKLIDKHVYTFYKHYCKCKGDEKKKRWSLK
ncbi:MAG TPA: metalloregulator ArsR/SmtB family transcription factor [Bacteroidia bacterium]|nr:metalloregulator ArsR/SmtB family transcription factor [Bacteroidia bacterium]